MTVPETPHIQTVPPNKATRETIYVILAAVLVVFLSVIIIHFNQRPHDDVTSLQSFETSARYDLTPAEQGIFADLLLVYEDWLLQQKSAANPSIDMLIADNWPPFTDVAEHKNRGAHQWQKIHRNGRDAYLGLSQDKTLAGDFLWVLPPSRENASLADLAVWTTQDSSAAGTASLTDLTTEQLIAAGWRKINRQNDIKR